MRIYREVELGADRSREGRLCQPAFVGGEGSEDRMTPVWLAFASGVVLGSFITLVCVAAFMLRIANRTGRTDLKS